VDIARSEEDFLPSRAHRVVRTREDPVFLAYNVPAWNGYRSLGRAIRLLRLSSNLSDSARLKLVLGLPRAHTDTRTYEMHVNLRHAMLALVSRGYKTRARTDVLFRSSSNLRASMRLMPTWSGHITQRHLVGSMRYVRPSPSSWTMSCILFSVPVLCWCWYPTSTFWRPSRQPGDVRFSTFCDFCKHRPSSSLMYRLKNCSL